MADDRRPTTDLAPPHTHTPPVHGVRMLEKRPKLCHFVPLFGPPGAARGRGGWLRKPLPHHGIWLEVWATGPPGSEWHRCSGKCHHVCDLMFRPRVPGGDGPAGLAVTPRSCSSDHARIRSPTCSGCHGGIDSCGRSGTWRLRYERSDWRRHREVHGGKDSGRGRVSPGRRPRRYYGRSNLARSAEGFGGTRQVEFAGCVVAALCGLDRAGRGSGASAMGPAFPRSAGAVWGVGVSWTDAIGRGRGRPESRGSASARPGQSPGPAFKEGTRK
jgi:hypothetical protein